MAPPRAPKRAGRPGAETFDPGFQNPGFFDPEKIFDRIQAFKGCKSPKSGKDLLRVFFFQVKNVFSTSSAGHSEDRRRDGNVFSSFLAQIARLQVTSNIITI